MDCNLTFKTWVENVTQVSQLQMPDLNNFRNHLLISADLLEENPSWQNAAEYLKRINSILYRLYENWEVSIRPHRHTGYFLMDSFSNNVTSPLNSIISVIYDLFRGFADNHSSLTVEKIRDMPQKISKAITRMHYADKPFWNTTLPISIPEELTEMWKSILDDVTFLFELLKNRILDVLILIKEKYPYQA